jgi:hypothetical protein
MKKEELEAIFANGEGPPDFGPIVEHLHALATERELPVLALGNCAIRFEESSPALRAIVIRAADGEALSEDEKMLAFRGLHILGGARDSATCQPLLRLLRRPNDEIDDLLGDAVTESLAKIVAGVFDGDVGALFGTIEDHSIDEFVREALLGAAAFLTWDGRIERDRMRHFLERFYQERPAADRDQAWIGWLQAIALLGMRDLAPLVHRAWDAGRVMPGVLYRSHFEQDLSEAERAPNDLDRLKRAYLGYIDDVVVALEWTRGVEGLPAGKGQAPLRLEPPSYSFEPVRNPWRHVGRNDPCPCGSGKKAKKCCLAN